MTSVNETNSDSLTGIPSDAKETPNLVENEIATDADGCSNIKGVEILSESCDDDDDDDDNDNSDDYESASSEGLYYICHCFQRSFIIYIAIL